MFATFFSTRSADFLALFYQMFRMLGMGGNETGRSVTDFGAIPVQPDTLYHHLNVLFVKTSVRTHFTRCGACRQFLE